MPADDEQPLSLDRLSTAPVTPDRSAPDVRHPPFVFIAMAAVAAAVLAVATLGATISRGAQFGFDRAIMLGLRQDGNPAIPDGPAWLRQVMIDITALGGETILTLFVAITIGFLIAYRHLLTAALVFGGTVSGSIAVALTKLIVGRERPALVDHLVEVGSASFPSGHAANSTIIYLTIALVCMQIVQRRDARWLMFGSTIALVTTIGFSRIYLGVHWPSDVAAGWAFGSLWALAWWALGAWLRVRLPNRR
ncbi:phosphatase PAP2 family protein [Sphingomonas sp. LT1P40]|uniref:phosphatase PAP2 family protein n=1 Tax=Alteristakelama amylovorans TaxID=3096166 RepID=UPI002FC7435A